MLASAGVGMWSIPGAMFFSGIVLMSLIILGPNNEPT